MTLSQTVGDRRVALGGRAPPLYGVYMLLLSFTALYYVLNANVLLGHLDLGWHLAAGDLIRSAQTIPLQDPWSFTLGNQQWFNLSWLWDVAASLTFQYAGLAGLVVAVVLCGALIVAYLTSACLNAGASPVAAAIAVFSACLLYPTFSTDPNTYLSASPNTVTMVFCTVFYVECLIRKRLALLPPLMVIWANLHGGFLLGGFILSVFFAVSVLKGDRQAIREFGLASIGCALCTLMNPLGWHVYAGIAATLGHFVQAQISEWQSYYSNFALPGAAPGLVYIVAFIILELRAGVFSEMPVTSRLLSWLFLFLGLYQFRYMAFFFIFSAVPLALHIHRYLPSRVNDEHQRSLLVAGIIGALALPLAFAKAQPSFTLSQMLSVEDAEYLKAHHSHSRLLNHWNVGGLLIFHTQGTVPVFVDGRAATAYPDGLLQDYLQLVNLEFDESAWDAALQKYQIDAVLWVKAHEPLRRFLVERRGWKEAYAGRYQSVYVRQ